MMVIPTAEKSELIEQIFGQRVAASHRAVSSWFALICMCVFGVLIIKKYYVLLIIGRLRAAEQKQWRVHALAVNY